MAFDTGEFNPAAPPLGIRNIGQASGRLIKEDNGIVNAADALQEVLTPGSGTAVNVTAAGGDLVVVTDTSSLLSTFENGRVLFESDFEAGLDTLNKFHLVYNGMEQVPGVVNASATGGDGEVTEVDFNLGRLPVTIDYAGTADTNQWVLQSQAPMKLKNSENTRTLISGIFSDSSSSGNVKNYKIGMRLSGGEFNVVLQNNWNIDTLNGSQDANNPSGITLSKGTMSTFVIITSLKDAGDVKFGFIINNSTVFVHQYIEKNATVIPFGLRNRPIRIEGSLLSGFCTLKAGIFDNNSGVFLITEDNTIAGSAPQYFFNSVSCFSSGANDNDYYRPFSAGNETTLITVGAIRRPLTSIKPKLIFPPGAVPIDNRVVISIKEINVSGTSVNLNDGVFIEIIFNQGPTLLTAAFFGSVDVDSSVDVDTSATAISAGGKQIYAAPIFSNQGKFSLSLNTEDLFSNFINNYTCSHITAIGGVDVNIDPTISIVATPLSVSANTVQLTATFVWGEKA